MAKIKITDVEEGMILIEDVKGAQGRLLLTKDTKITAKHIRVMKTWGVNVVHVEGDDDSEENTEINFTPEQLKEAQEQIKPSYKYVDLEHPFIAYLFSESTKMQARNNITENKN